MLPIDLLIVLVAFSGDLFLGLLSFYKNPKSYTNKFFLFFAGTLAIYLVTNFLSQHQSSDDLTYFWIKIVISTAALINLSFLLLASTFPKNKPSISTKIIGLSLVATIVVITMTLLGLIFKGVSPGTNQPIPGQLIPLFLIHTIVFLGSGFIILIRKLLKSNGMEKTQIRLFFSGAIFMFIGILITNLILVILFHTTAFVGLLPLNTLIFIGFTSYAIIRHRFLDIRLVVARTVTYTLIVMLMSYFFAGGLFILGTFITERPYSQTEIMVSTILALIMAYAFQPLSKFLEKITDKVFYKENYTASDVLGDISNLLAVNIDLVMIVNGVLDKIISVLHIDTGTLLLFKDERFDRFVGKYNPDLLMNLSVDEINSLSKINSPLTIFDDLEEGETKELLRKHEIGATMKLVANEKTVGVFVLGNKLSGEIYNLNDIRVLNILNPELSIAIQNAQQFETIKQFNEKLQGEIDKATQDLQIANEKLQDLDRKKDEFVSLASHELRTPMTAIRSYLWLALAGKGGALNDKQKYYLDRSYNSTVRLIKLVNDMLNVSRIESGRISLEMSKVNIVKLVEDVIGEVKPRADELGLKVVNQPDSSSPVPEVLADLDKIKEVLINFIGNSFKFSPKGSSIEITYKIDSGFVVVSVTDHGEGISPEDIDKLFQKFSLIKESYVTNQKAAQGTGLGLYISKNIIEMHGGKVWAESKGHGTGATFNFSLKVFSDTDLQKFQQENSGKQGLGIIPNVI